MGDRKIEGRWAGFFVIGVKINRNKLAFRNELLLASKKGSILPPFENPTFFHPFFCLPSFAVHFLSSIFLSIFLLPAVLSQSRVLAFLFFFLGSAEAGS
jgi:hypothetical protein